MFGVAGFVRFVVTASNEDSATVRMTPGELWCWPTVHTRGPPSSTADLLASGRAVLHTKADGAFDVPYTVFEHLHVFLLWAGFDLASQNLGLGLGLFWL